MVGMVESSYYRKPSNGRKGNTPSKLTYNKSKGWVEQPVVLDAVKRLLAMNSLIAGIGL